MVELLQSHEFSKAFMGQARPIAAAQERALFPDRPTRKALELVNDAVELMYSPQLGLSRLVFLGVPVYVDPAKGDAVSNRYRGGDDLRGLFESMGLAACTGIFLDHHRVSPSIGAQLTHSVLALASTYVADIRPRQPGAGMLAEMDTCRGRGATVIYLVSDEAYSKMQNGDGQHNHLPSYHGWNSHLITNLSGLPEMVFRSREIACNAREQVFGGRGIDNTVAYMLSVFLLNYAARSPEFLSIANEALGHKV